MGGNERHDERYCGTGRNADHEPLPEPAVTGRQGASVVQALTVDLARKMSPGANNPPRSAAKGHREGRAPLTVSSSSQERRHPRSAPHEKEGTGKDRHEDSGRAFEKAEHESQEIDFGGRRAGRTRRWVEIRVRTEVEREIVLEAGEREISILAHLELEMAGAEYREAVINAVYCDDLLHRIA